MRTKTRTSQTAKPDRHRPRKRFGQHFLSPAWAGKIVAAVSPCPGDVFLEIGPGTGALTLPLAAAGAPVLAVEIDRDLVANLAGRVPRNVTIMTGDILETDVLPYLSGLEPQRPAGWTGPAQPARRFRVVGNLPYGISSPILFRLLEIHRRHQFFADATLMLQREVADRLLARPGTKDYGVLTVLIAMHARISRLLDLPPGAFTPPPKVRSTLVRLAFGPAAVRVSNEALFDRIVRTMFTQRRKTLTNALKRLDPAATTVLQQAGIDARRRPETLQLTEIARLAELFAVRARTAVL
jgi:16S rRNA (adenine1518-N6/adenine1519-N6)-dimethyltransferase